MTAEVKTAMDCIADELGRLKASRNRLAAQLAAVDRAIEALESAGLTELSNAVPLSMKYHGWALKDAIRDALETRNLQDEDLASLTKYLKQNGAYVGKHPAREHVAVKIAARMNKKDFVVNDERVAMKRTRT